MAKSKQFGPGRLKDADDSTGEYCEISIKVTKKKDKDYLDEYQRIKSEMLFDQVDEILEKHPDNYIEKLEELGFAYHEEEDYETIEEDKAIPQNDRQKYLLSYFDGEHELSEITLQAFLEERESEHPNYALIRKYFKKANPRLRALLLYGLDQDPTDIDLLRDLSFFHEFQNILEDLIKRFVCACQEERNLLNFSEIIQEFYSATFPDGYDAMSKLRSLFPLDTEKGGNIEFVFAELLKDEGGSEPVEL